MSQSHDAAREKILAWAQTETPHYDCEDRWYSCATLTCDEERQSALCDCGADETNTIKAALREFLSPSPALSGEARDAARYRWLRSEEVATEPKYYEFWIDFKAKLCREEAMDKLIDAAMKDSQ
jgi:hypothetical protein